MRKSKITFTKNLLKLSEIMGSRKDIAARNKTNPR